MIKIKLSKDFTNKPGGRYIKEGPKSGEEFREHILLPQYEKAIQVGCKLVVDLDDCYGFPPSFLEEAFGGLARKVKSKKILDTIEIHCTDRPGLIDKIRKYVQEAL